MAVLPDITRIGYHMQELRIVDDRGRSRSTPCHWTAAATPGALQSLMCGFSSAATPRWCILSALLGDHVSACSPPSTSRRKTQRGRAGALHYRAVALPRDLGSHLDIIDPALPGLDQPRLDIGELGDREWREPHIRPNSPAR